MQRYARRIAGPLVLVVALTLGCQSWNPQTKEKVGTVAGLVIGGTIGALVAGDPEVGIAIGAAIGALVGNRFGAWLDKRDQEMLARSTQEAIVTGQEQHFENEETGVTGVVRVEDIAPFEEVVEIPVHPERVAEMPPIEFIGDVYEVKKGSNVRGGPSTDYAVVSSLGGGELVHVVGKVQDRDWYLIGQDGAASGYVYAELLEPAPLPEVPDVSPDAAEDAPVVAAAAPPPQRPRGIDLEEPSEETAATGSGPGAPGEVEAEPERPLDPISSFFASRTTRPEPEGRDDVAAAPASAASTSAAQPASAPVAADAEGPHAGPAAAAEPAAPKASFMATSFCRTVTQEITRKDGTERSQQVKACRGPNGWEIVETHEA